MDAVQQCRRLLHLVNDVALRLRVCLDNLFDPLRMGNVISECLIVQQVYQVGFRKSFFKPGGFARTSWAENKEAISRRAKESFSEFVYRFQSVGFVQLRFL